MDSPDWRSAYPMLIDLLRGQAELDALERRRRRIRRIFLDGDWYWGDQRLGMDDADGWSYQNPKEAQ